MQPQDQLLVKEHAVKWNQAMETCFFALSRGLLVNVKEAHPSLADA
jgi:hypothetical protein